MLRDQQARVIKAIKTQYQKINFIRKPITPKKWILISVSVLFIAGATLDIQEVWRTGIYNEAYRIGYDQGKSEFTMDVTMPVNLVGKSNSFLSTVFQKELYFAKTSNNKFILQISKENYDNFSADSSIMVTALNTDWISSKRSAGFYTKIEWKTEGTQ